MTECGRAPEIIYAHSENPGTYDYGKFINLYESARKWTFDVRAKKVVTSTAEEGTQENDPKLRWLATVNCGIPLDVNATIGPHNLMEAGMPSIVNLSDGSTVRLHPEEAYAERHNKQCGKPPQCSAVMQLQFTRVYFWVYNEPQLYSVECYETRDEPTFCMKRRGIMPPVGWSTKTIEAINTPCVGLAFGYDGMIKYFTYIDRHKVRHYRDGQLEYTMSTDDIFNCENEKI